MQGERLQTMRARAWGTDWPEPERQAVSTASPSDAEARCWCPKTNPQASRHPQELSATRSCPGCWPPALLKTLAPIPGLQSDLTANVIGPVSLLGRVLSAHCQVTSGGELVGSVTLKSLYFSEFVYRMGMKPLKWPIKVNMSSKDIIALKFSCIVVCLQK